MKKIAICIVMATLCLNFKASCQNVIDNITELKTGDVLPEKLWNLPLSVIDSKGGINAIQLSKYRKQKLIILDFWATWCAPCINSLTQLDSIQNVFKSDLKVLPITYENKDKIFQFNKTKGWKLQSVVADTTVVKFFPHKSIPHQILIKNGKVYAVTTPEYINTANIEKIIKGLNTSIKIKDESVKFDESQPLLVNGNGGNGDNLLYQSTLTSRMPLDIGGMSITPNGIMAYNCPLFDLFIKAYMDDYPYASQNRTRISWEVSDSLYKEINGIGRNLVGNYERDKSYYEWQSNNVYCYNLSFKSKVARKKILEMMKDDLNRSFRETKGIIGSLELKSVKHLAIERINDKINIRSKNFNEKFDFTNGNFIIRNSSFSSLVSSITTVFANLSENPIPVVDCTGINYKVDLDLKVSSLTNLTELQNALQKYGLNIVERTSKIEMLVIKETTNNRLNN